MVVIVVMIVMWTCHVDVVHTRILQAKIVPLDTNFFISIMFEHSCTEVRISQETIVDPFETPFDASFSNYGLDDILFVVEFSHICGHEVAPS